MSQAKHDYTEFDSLMLQQIRAGIATAASLEAALAPQIKPFVTKQGEEFRVVDRRLQALRKKDEIACRRVGRSIIWYIVAPSLRSKG